MRIECCDAPPKEWSDFVDEHADAALGHAAPWCAVFRQAYGLRGAWLVARGEDGGWRGILPSVALRGLDGRRDLVSLPYLDEAGVLARDGEAERALLARAARTASARGCRRVELRQGRPLAGLEPVASSRVAMTLELPADEATLWRALPGKVRNQTRKATRSGLEAQVGGEEAVADFHAVHRVRMRELGSPVHAERFFRAAAQAFGPRLRIVLARDGREGGRPVGALVAIRHGDAVTVPWASTLRSHDRACPGNLIYWEALRLAVAEGATRFEFGRSAPGSGTHRFKRGWGARERPLPWARITPAGAVAPARPPQDSPALELLSRVWRRLPPVVCDRVGPRVRPHIAS